MWELVYIITDTNQWEGEGDGRGLGGREREGGRDTWEGREGERRGVGVERELRGWGERVAHRKLH